MNIDIDEKIIYLIFAILIIFFIVYFILYMQPNIFHPTFCKVDGLRVFEDYYNIYDNTYRPQYFRGKVIYKNNSTSDPFYDYMTTNKNCKSELWDMFNETNAAEYIIEGEIENIGNEEQFNSGIFISYLDENNTVLKSDFYNFGYFPYNSIKKFSFNLKKERENNENYFNIAKVIFTTIDNRNEYFVNSNLSITKKT